MSARLAAVLLVVAGLDDLERVQLAGLLVAEMNGEGLAQQGVEFVRRLDQLAKTDRAAADQLAQAVAATFRDWTSTMAGALTESIERGASPVTPRDPATRP